MEGTPQKLVHWALDISMSEFGSPLSNASSDSTTSTSSLQYINSQLIAHGFTQNPGISLEGLSKEDMDRAVKCLLGMLSQRVDDMSRAEDLTTKIRTLSYEHERLMAMCKTAREKSATAEREASTHKSRLASITQALQTAENAHKRTTAELQRLRTTLQGLRDTHKAEVKKIEREKDKMAERWGRLADNQLKLGSTVSSGIRFSNSQVVEAADVQLRGKGKGFLEVALEEAERSRDGLASENKALRGLVLSSANELQRVLHTARNLASSETKDEPSPLTIASLFPISPADAAADKMTALLKSLKELSERLASEHSVFRASSTTSSSPLLPEKPKPQEQSEIDRLQAVITSLKAELERSIRSSRSSSYASQTQALFDRFASDQRLANGGPRDASVELMTAPARDEERERLDQRNHDLEEERRKFTEAAVRLGKEKASLEAERIKFLEEKRSWQVQTMLSELPPTPAIASSSTPPPHPPTVPPTTAFVEPHPSSKSPKKSSPRKPTHRVKSSSTALKGTSPRKTRVSRRSSGLDLFPLSPKSKANNTSGRVIPAFETEVIPPLLAKSTTFPEFKTNLDMPAPPIMSQAFVLPPPSPGAKLPPPGSFLDMGRSKPPIAGLDLRGGMQSTTPSEPLSIQAGGPRKSNEHDSAGSGSSRSSSSSDLSIPPMIVPSQAHLQAPTTPLPRHQQFPVAKPFAQRMIHAYSPVKPSPLSRILMMADSPEGGSSGGPSGLITGLDVLREEGDKVSLEVSPTPLLASSVAPPVVVIQAPALEVEGEEYVEDEEDESPLAERGKLRKEASHALPTTRTRHKPTSNPSNAAKVKAKSSSSQRLRTEHGRAVSASKTPNPPVQTKERSTKTRSESSTATKPVKVVSMDLEKENLKRRKAPTSTSSSTSSSSSSSSSAAALGKKPPPSSAAVKQSSRGTAPVSTTAAAKSGPVPVKKGGPRRVPIDSAEAAPTGAARRG